MNYEQLLKASGSDRLDYLMAVAKKYLGDSATLSISSTVFISELIRVEFESPAEHHVRYSPILHLSWRREPGIGDAQPIVFSVQDAHRRSAEILSNKNDVEAIIVDFLIHDLEITLQRLEDITKSSYTNPRVEISDFERRTLYAQMVRLKKAMEHVRSVYQTAV